LAIGDRAIEEHRFTEYRYRQIGSSNDIEHRFIGDARRWPISRCLAMIDGGTPLSDYRKSID